MTGILRWVIAVLLVLLGFGAALLVILGGAFSTVACIQVPPDWTYYLLVLVGVLVGVSASWSALLVTRRSRAFVITIPVVLGTLVMCGGLTAYFAILGTYC